MRMNPHDELTAADVVNRTREEELADLIYQLGEERASRRIARAIVRARERAPITTTAELARIVRGAAHRGGRWKIDPATRTFQALRIHVNAELRELETSLVPIAERLKDHRRLAVISFHSLEDRIVKHTFAQLRRQGFQVLTKKPLEAGDAEVEQNAVGRPRRDVLGDIRVTRVEEASPIAEAREVRARAVQRPGIAVEAEQMTARSAAPQDLRRVAAETQRAVDVRAARLHVEQSHDFAHEHRLVQECAPRRIARFHTPPAPGRRPR
jgi:hypothetical protein